MLALVEPTIRLRDAWLDAHHEWDAGPREDGFGVGDADVETEDGFADWVARLVRLADPSTLVAPGESHCTFRWIVDDGVVLGGIVLRHDLTEFVSRMGHIGYGVRPSARGRGVATWALGEMLGEARALGLVRVLIVYEADNLASARVIEHCGGRLEDRSDATHPSERRAWITLDE